MRKLAGLTIVWCVLLLFSAHAAEEPKPDGRVILTVSGKIVRQNSERGFSFDRKMIEQLGMRRLVTSTNWTDGVQTFEGVWMRDLMAYLGAEGTMVSATALNDYAVNIPMSDFGKYDVLLALKMDGVDLHVRDKGPLWIVYPHDDFAELRNEEVNSRWIWQLTSLVVK